MITVLGGSGYVGSAFRDFLTREEIPHELLCRAEIDYTDTATLKAHLRDRKPEFLINAAGYTGKPNVDACEDHKAECLFGNSVLPGRIAEACSSAGIPWAHVSSGCIYSGRRPDGDPFTEEDVPNFSFRSAPSSFYSGTKALGEEVLAGAPDLYIMRLRIPFDHVDGPRNYLTKLLHYERLLEAENSISHLGEFVSATVSAWQKRIPFGTYNVTNPGVITTKEAVALIGEILGVNKDFRYFSDEDEFITTAARSPRSNCALSSAKLSAAGIKLTGVHEAVRSALENWKTQ